MAAKLRTIDFGPWTGMNEKVSPDILPKDKAADLSNVLLDEAPGRVVKRGGTSALSALPSGLSPRDGYVFTKLDGTAYLLVSDGVTLYSTTDPSQVALWAVVKTGLNPDGLMVFETDQNLVWMSNGEDPFMSWDGTTLLVYDRSYTSTTDASSVSSTTIVHTGLTSAVTDYWKGMKLVFTLGANVGTVVTITGFDATAHKLTFSPAVSTIATTDRWIVGVVIPAGSALRYYDGHLFIGCTTVNQAELRFNSLSDQDTGEVITVDNPRAWSAKNELALNVLDQDRIWGISPILRDRILVMKSSGLFRVERDPVALYRLAVVSRTVGSRFPDTWAEKKNLLYFVGQDKDAYPDVFKTDMVDVSPVDPDGGVEPTLRSLQQPNQLFASQTFASKADFDAGTLSTLVDDNGGALSIGGMNTQAAFLSALVSGANVDLETTPGVVTLLGSPQWEQRYEGDFTPDQIPVPWKVLAAISPNPFTPPQTVQYASGGALTIFANDSNKFGGYYYTKDNLLSPTQDTLFSIRCTSAGVPFFVELENGAYGVVFSWVGDGSPHTYTCLLKADGTYKMWQDGTLFGNGSATRTSVNKISWGMAFTGGIDLPIFAVPPASSTSVDFVYFHSNFKGDQLSSQGGKIAPIAMPNTLPTTGNIVLLNDCTRAPAAMRRLYATTTFSAELAICGTTAGSVTVQLATTTDMAQFSATNVVYLRNLSDGSLITNGSARIIQTVDATNHRIVLDSGGGNVTTDSTVGVFDVAGDSIALSSWTSTTTDFSTGNDPAGYVATAQGDIPTSQAKRAQRIQIALNGAGDYANGPILTDLYSGTLWLSPPVSVGAQISAWRTFLDTLITPAGCAQTIQIRNATTTATPVESDWGSWITIANGNNIGTILSDTASPPTSRWVQLKIEQGPTSAGLLPEVDAADLQWTTGSIKNLPIRAVVHKKRYMVTAARAGASANDIIVVCDRNDQWTKFFGLSFNALLHFKSQFYGLDGGDSKVSMVDIVGRLDDYGVAIDAFLITKEEGMGATSLRKNCRYSYFHVDNAAGVYTLEVSHKRTGDATFMGAATLTFGTTGLDVRQNLPFGTVGRRIQRKYENSIVGEDMRLMNETMYYDIRPAQPI